jgi:SOS-response transcriptional repressor LexA
MSVTVELTIDQLARAIASLNPSDAETLIETLEQQNLLARWEQVKREVAAGDLVTEEELFADLE